MYLHVLERVSGPDKKTVKECLEEHKAQEAKKPAPKLLTIEQTAEYLSLAKTSMYGLTSSNSVPFMKVGKKLYFKEEDLAKWVESSRNKTNRELRRKPWGITPRTVESKAARLSNYSDVVRGFWSLWGSISRLQAPTPHRNRPHPIENKAFRMQRPDPETI
ncbi:helix-turn-helix domain-containing protein [Sabulibacter ruber]|uniref:helix-turn-helix domain-containing protein n=1 Tax=Sabulibacter ruber TaxID=2811901 RepID=UPI001A96532B